ncbi:hypothetical protein [Deinococcus multiflagellatus]|uniref:hypothetical protein n=1 Tax=Deinococcus multiflagellatus TaxID=1656887 RepID=UPI001CCA91D8|nr:hypothetical protein [Deinococcus multiflagellatus]MBZ9715358.1 hypothetical protein [Deinococcus multiflagellatus]
MIGLPGFWEALTPEELATLQALARIYQPLLSPLAQLAGPCPATQERVACAQICCDYLATGKGNGQSFEVVMGLALLIKAYDGMAAAQKAEAVMKGVRAVPMTTLSVKFLDARGFIPKGSVPA